MTVGLSARETVLASEPRFGDRVGLLAGGGGFPAHFAQAAASRGVRVVCVAVRGHADGSLRLLVERFYWAGLARVGRMIRCFHREQITTVVMAGKIHKTAMFAPWRLFRHLPDWRTIRLWLCRRRRDNADDSLLLSVIDEFKREGIAFASALEICPELLVPQGVATRRRPTRAELADVLFGWKLAKEMGRLDVGQSVLVKESAVLAVEAIEGTDQAIARAGRLCPAGGFTLVKVAKPNQDVRFDVPTIGPETVETLRRAGGKVLAVEANRTILLDREETIRRADWAGITIVALSPQEVDTLQAA
jgi:DUF1009 family protein